MMTVWYEYLQQNGSVPEWPYSICYGEEQLIRADVLVLGGGIAGCHAAINARRRGAQVVVLEKGSEVGAHILSGAVIDPVGLNRLIPDWKDRGAPVETAVTGDDIYFLTSETKGIRTPGLFVPRPMHNHGNYIISLGRLCQWLGEQAEALGVNVFPGFAASEVLYDAEGRVTGVATSDMGIDKAGNRKSSYTPGYELLGKYTIFAEGVRGNLSEQLMDRFDLRIEVPPVGFQALLRADAHDRGTVERFLREAAALLPPGESRLFGPVPAIMERVGGRWRMYLVLQAGQRSVLHGQIDAWLPPVRALPSARRVRWSMDIDPQEL